MDFILFSIEFCISSDFGWFLLPGLTHRGDFTNSPKGSQMKGSGMFGLFGLLALPGLSWPPSAQISTRKAPDLSATSARLKHDRTADNANVRLKGDKAAAIASSAAQGSLRQCRWISAGAR